MRKSHWPNTTTQSMGARAVSSNVWEMAEELGRDWPEGSANAAARMARLALETRRTLWEVARASDIHNEWLLGKVTKLHEQLEETPVPLPEEGAVYVIAQEDPENGELSYLPYHGYFSDRADAEASMKSLNDKACVRYKAKQEAYKSAREAWQRLAEKDHEQGRVAKSYGESIHRPVPPRPYTTVAFNSRKKES